MSAPLMPAPLHLEFELGADRYLLPVAQVAAVLPLPALKALPGAPEGVAGVLNYRGKPVPVLDLPRLALGRPAELRRGTRLVLVNYPAPAGSRLLGLIVERATTVARVAAEAFETAGSPAAAWLGDVAAPPPPPAPPPTGSPDRRRENTVGRGAALAQRIEVAGLLPPDLRAVLFAAVETAAADEDEAAGDGKEARAGEAPR